ncbi:CPBP family intramembrane glutamic endopeptidase [Bacillus cereus]|uniref:CPBP family intramembrane glutamic endopeptidase n=1 Tax=Bacillus TaxID=1386 RepID=UPI003012FFAA
MKKIYKSALKFSLYMLPIGIIGGVLSGFYSFLLMNQEMHNQILAQTSKEMYILIVSIQSGILYAGIMGFFGYVLADKVNLLKKFNFAKRNVLITVGISTVASLFFIILDNFIFARMMPEVAATYTKDNYSLLYLVTSVIYGGVLEEIMVRLFIMSLISFILWKLFARSKEKENIPVWIFVCANILSALLFAAGHIPATILTFGALNTLLLIRCFLLNGIFGMIFGWLYQKMGLQYAIIAHALVHAIRYIILAGFLL